MRPLQIFFLFVFILGWVACSEDDVLSASGNQSGKLFRAVEIKGTNSHWGDYDWTFVYENNRLASGVRCNAEGDTLGTLEVTRQSAIKYQYTVYDKVPDISADSIWRLEQRLEAAYGAGNYSLKDSIPLEDVVYLQAVVDLYDDGRIVQQTFTQYVPKEDNTENGGVFDPSYVLQKKTSLLYEYDGGSSNILICRKIEDVYSLADAEVYERTLAKEEFVYDGSGRIVEVVCYEAPGGESFQEVSRNAYTYQDGELWKVTGGSYQLKFSWEDGLLTALDYGGMIVTYGWDANHCLESIVDPSSSRHVTYESGSGNIFWLFPLSYQLLGIPVID